MSLDPIRVVNLLSGSCSGPPWPPTAVTEPHEPVRFSLNLVIKLILSSSVVAPHACCSLWLLNYESSDFDWLFDSCIGPNWDVLSCFLVSSK